MRKTPEIKEGLREYCEQDVKMTSDLYAFYAAEAEQQMREFYASCVMPRHTPLREIADFTIELGSLEHGVIIAMVNGFSVCVAEPFLRRYCEGKLP